MELEGVDPEPDFWARSIRGPWHIAVNEDCAQQFKERYGDITTLRINQTDISVRVKVESIDEKINKQGSSSRKALYNALQDVAAHLVIEAEGLAQAAQINLSAIIFAIEIEKVGLTFLKGNRERMKLEGGAGTFVSKAAYSTRWHLYVLAGQGSFLDGSFPRKLLLLIDGKTIPVNYAVRACKAISMPANIQSPHKLMIHGSLRGCKGWRPEAAKGLPNSARMATCSVPVSARHRGRLSAGSCVSGWSDPWGLSAKSGS